MKELTAQERHAQAEFTVRLVDLMDQAARVGLYRTMHKLHDAVREVGYERAGVWPDEDGKYA